MTTTIREGGAASRPVLPTRTRALFLALVSLLATVPAIGLVVTAGSEAEAHGTPMKPGSRTFLYRQDALTGTGEIKPVNPACTAAARVGGATPFSDRFSVPRSDGAVRIRRFVPDGQLCGGGNTRFTGFDTPGADRPLTHLTAGATVDFSCNTLDAHPGWLHVHATEDGFDPTRALTWADQEEQPSLSVDPPPLHGSPDSRETFSSCSDVVFDGGHGEVTGIREPGAPTGPVPGACTATRRTTGSWNGGHRSEVTVTDNGDVPMLGRMADRTLPDGRRIDGLWGGDATYDGQDVTVHDAGRDGSLGPGRSTTFGHVVFGPGGDAATSLPCRVG
ncbi:lytic polysaccharide monooxygenase [Streptomyces heliomycini]|uniref:Lytic polysaccharide monooxygenase n=1 Tax=Streptomyces heliomycini TaxID=284032 RepID=A0ABV5L2B0_9ACTN